VRREGLTVKNEVRRGALARLTIWTGIDGPLPLTSGSVGLEYRGRIGHPSSYGLLAAALRVGEKETEFAQFVDRANQVSPPLNGEEVIVGTLDREYADAVNSVCLQRGIGLIVEASAAGEISSSSVVFSKLATVLCELLKRESLDVQESELWEIWESA
jgi:hypothetical protein